MKRQFFKQLQPGRDLVKISVSDYQFNDRISNLSFALSILIIIVCFLLVVINYNSLPPEIPQYLQRQWGVEQLAPRNMIWLQPGLLLVFFLTNYAISLFTMKNEPLTARILGGTILICSFMSLIALWNSMNLVISVKLWF
jgi:Na+/melibiose symporter-like transporter